MTLVLLYVFGISGVRSSSIQVLATNHLHSARVVGTSERAYIVLSALAWGPPMAREGSMLIPRQGTRLRVQGRRTTYGLRTRESTTG